MNPNEVYHASGSNGLKELPLYVEKYLPHLVPQVRQGLSGDSDAG